MRLKEDVPMRGHLPQRHPSPMHHQAATVVSAVAIALFAQACDPGKGPPAVFPFPGVSPEVTAVVQPRVALDGNGFAVVSYEELNSRNSDESTVRVARYRFADRNFLDAVGFAASKGKRHVLAADESGTATEILRAPGPFSNEPLRSCQSQPGQSWSCTDIYSPANTGADPPGSVAMDGAGRVLALDQGGELGAFHLTPGTPWTVRGILSTTASDIADHNALAYWSGGTGFAVWEDFQPNVHSVRSRRYLRASDTWEPEVVLSTGGDPGSDSVPQIAMHRRGPNSRAIAVWISILSAPRNVQINQYSPGVGWQGSQTLPGSEDPSALKGHSVAMAGNGDVMIAWVVNETVLASRLVNGAFEPIRTIGSATFAKTRIAMDGVGNAIVIWSSETDLRANRYIVGQGWQGSQSIGTPASSGNFDVDMDESGRFLVAWAGDAGPAFPPGSTRLRTYVGGGFSLALTPAVLPLQRNGDSQLANVAVTRFAYTGTVDLQIFDCPSKVICVLNRSQIPGTENTAELRFITNVNDPAPAGNYVVRVTGTGGGVTTDAFVEVQIQ